MKQILPIIIALIIASSCDVKAQNPIDSTLSGQTLITKLRNDYTPNQTLGYGPARDYMYSIIDNDGNNGVHGIYSDFIVYWTPGTDPSSNVYQGGSGINAEHIFPQSMGASSEPARSDMYNLRPSRAAVNSARGNSPFGEVPDSNTDDWYKDATSQSNIPTSDIDAWSERETSGNGVFEPREVVKGNIARSVFYFFTIYTNADASFFNGMKETLLQWHYDDPVDAAELTRNNGVKSQQGNDNPFILDSTLARRAYFPHYIVTSTEDLTVENEIDVTVFPNPFTNTITFSEAVNNVSIVDGKQSVVLEYSSEQQSITTLDVSELPKGMYWIRYGINEKEGVKMIIKQ